MESTQHQLKADTINCCIPGLLFKCGAGVIWAEHRICRFAKKSNSQGLWQVKSAKKKPVTGRKNRLPVFEKVVVSPVNRKKPGDISYLEPITSQNAVYLLLRNSNIKSHVLIRTIQAIRLVFHCA